MIPGIEGRWLELPDQLDGHELGVVAHMLDGYTLSSEFLNRDACEVVERTRTKLAEMGSWQGTAIELLVSFFARVRGWRGLYDGPGESEIHEAQAIYEAVRRRLREHPDEVEFVPAAPREES